MISRLVKTTITEKSNQTDRVQALADISHSALYAFAVYKQIYMYVVIAAKPVHQLPSSAQLEVTSYHSTKLHLGPCSSVGMWRGTDRLTDTQTVVTTIHF